MAETQKEKEDRLRREAEARTQAGGDSSFVAVNTLPRKETATTATGMKETARTETQSTTEKIGATLHEAKEDVKEAVTPGPTEAERQRMEEERRRAAVGTTAAVGTAAAAGKAMAKAGETRVTSGEMVTPERTEAEKKLGAAGATAAAGTAMNRPGVKIETKEMKKGANWEQIQHPGMEPCDEDPYGTRSVSELTPPTDVKDKADLAAVRMMEREKADHEKMDRDRIMTEASEEAAAARAAMASKEMTPAEIEAERERRMKTGAVVGGAALATGAAAKQAESKAGAGEEMAPAGTQGQHWSGEPWAKNPKVGGKETAEAEAEAARGRMMTEPGAAGAVAMTPVEIEAERERTKAGPAVAGAAVATGAAAKQAESEAERERRMKTGAVVGGAALAAGAAATRTSPGAGERTTKAGAAPKTELTPVAPERLVPGVVIPQETATTKPLKPYGTVDERTRRHAEDQSVHPDWETQPQINAPMDVGIPTTEGQADAARIREGRRRSNEAREPRMERRGDEVTVPPASSARAGGVTGAVKETASDIEKKTKETVSEVKKDVDRKI